MKITYVCDEFTIRHIKIIFALRKLRPDWMVSVLAKNFRSPEFTPYFYSHQWTNRAQLELGLKLYPPDVLFVAPSFDFDIFAVAQKTCPGALVVLQVFDWLVDRVVILDAMARSRIGIVGCYADANTIEKELTTKPIVIYPAIPEFFVPEIKPKEPFPELSLAYFGGINDKDDYRNYLPVFSRFRAQGWRHPITVYSAASVSASTREIYEAEGIAIYEPQSYFRALSLLSRHSHVWVGASSPKHSYANVVRNVLFDVIMLPGVIPVSCGLAEQDEWMQAREIGEVVAWENIIPRSLFVPKHPHYAEDWVAELVRRCQDGE